MVTAGINYMHRRGLMHRDIKPENLLFDTGVLKVADLGSIRDAGRTALKLTTAVVTLWYRPPELLLGNTEYTSAIDIWSIGCVIVEFLTMSALFPGRDVDDMMFRVSFPFLSFPFSLSFPLLSFPSHSLFLLPLLPSSPSPSLPLLPPLSSLSSLPLPPPLPSSPPPSFPLSPPPLPFPLSPPSLSLLHLPFLISVLCHLISFSPLPCFPSFPSPALSPLLSRFLPLPFYYLPFGALENLIFLFLLLEFPLLPFLFTFSFFSSFSFQENPRMENRPIWAYNCRYTSYLNQLETGK